VSNAWALAGSRTSSGQPLVAGDPHRLVEVHGVYYQSRLACPEFDALGLSFVGVPGFPHFGQTDRVAWCVTNANGDYQDLYVERFRDDGSLRYQAAGEWREPARRVETIGIHDSDAISVECFERWRFAPPRWSSRVPASRSSSRCCAHRPSTSSTTSCAGGSTR
jgi:penicillin amidase